MIAADTITDEQTRELKREAEIGRMKKLAELTRVQDQLALLQKHEELRALRKQFDAADDALDEDGMHGDAIKFDGRARCAEILNARVAKAGDR
jgi:hypothetical protein